ncbi:Phosphopantetheine adenylyltransferase [Candidatus Arsenophonus lipoptenae]|uniref:Phosphopantetheine adenylyltransferase n=1 Tax=Candidatus Arsenophonus lipoptenae TaxID=634113 RepID=A0A0X9VIE3_9GAMM|nr:pantetheine-phosphate adenylyltransferase [Candidatus Arsenophonus lipoptenae]AMA64720.1 Phosphopantetheine adenylyltransferase [Candidatus Arsenophonus lipoptenae]
MKNTATAMYPGSFDPITYGHLDIIERASLIFDRLILAISGNSQKKLMFNLDERIFFAKKYTKHLTNIEITGFHGLTVNYARKQHINILIKGIRSVSDFEYEFKLANMNNYLITDIETIFLLSSPKLSFVSSSLIKEVISLGGDVSSFLPKSIIKAILQKLKKINLNQNYF